MTFCRASTFSALTRILAQVPYMLPLLDRPGFGRLIKSRTAGSEWVGRGSGFQRRRLVALAPGVGPAVDHHGRAGDVAAAVAREEGDRGGDLLGRAGPAHRDLIGERVDHLLTPVLEDALGLDHA